MDAGARRECKRSPRGESLCRAEKRGRLDYSDEESTGFGGSFLTERECSSLRQEASGTCCHRQVEREVHVGEENVFVVHILNFYWDLWWCSHEVPRPQWTATELVLGGGSSRHGVQVGLTLMRFGGQRRSRRCVRTDMKNIAVPRGGKCDGDTSSRV